MKSYRAIIATMLFLHLAAASFSADLATLNKQGVDAFNRGDYRSALTCFINAVKLAPADRTLAANVVASCRSLAGQSATRSDWGQAAAALREGLAALPANQQIRSDLVTVLVNSGTTFLNSRDFSRAQAAAAEALQLDGGNAAALCFAGDIAYARHDLASARSSWEHARKVQPGNPEIAERMAHLQKEQGAEKSYSQMGAYSFDIRFDYKALGNGVIDLREFLMQAYEKVGQDFNRFPDYPIVVILSDENDFRMVNNAPVWVAGLYDGKIRIPVNFSRISASTLKGVIFHEYTHALVHDLTGNACPIWLNEGLAMHEMNNTSLIATSELRQAVAAGTVLSIEQLCDHQRTWRNTATVNIAYAQSWIMAEYLLSRWSTAQVKNILLRLKQGADFATILRNDMNRTPEQFEQEWLAFARSRL